MDNASLILQTLDARLKHPTRMILYGRAALQLGFANPPRETANSKDVDVVVALGDSEALLADESFWDAQEAANLELRPSGLYITHLFRADQVFLRPDWEQHLVPISRPTTRWLRLFRLATLDLILTKMMRGDDVQDMADIAFLLGHDRPAAEEIERALAGAVIPDLPELSEAFDRAKLRVREMARHPGRTEP